MSEKELRGKKSKAKEEKETVFINIRVVYVT